MPPFGEDEADNVKGCSLGAWNAGPEENTSDEDEDGVIRPKRCKGRVGRGSPMRVFARWGSEGIHGWMRPLFTLPLAAVPAQRDPITITTRNQLQEYLVETMGDLTQVAFAMAHQRFKMSPFTDERLHSGRKVLEKEAKEKTIVELPLENAKKEYGDDLRMKPKWSETAHLESRWVSMARAPRVA